jgi:hypothetical protein
LPEGTYDTAPPNATFNNGAYVERRTIRRNGGLAGHSIAIQGLSVTSTDVLARIETLGGAVQTERLAPTRTSFVVQTTTGAGDVAVTYLRLGAEHILFGFDHLLFVLALTIFGSRLAPRCADGNGIHGGAQSYACGGNARFRQRAWSAD